SDPHTPTKTPTHTHSHTKVRELTPNHRVKMLCRSHHFGCLHTHTYTHTHTPTKTHNTHTQTHTHTHTRTHIHTHTHTHTQGHTHLLYCMHDSSDVFDQCFIVCMTVVMYLSSVLLHG